MKTKTFVFTIILLAFFSLVQATPLTVRCTGGAKWGNQTVKVQIEIVLPDSQDRIVSFYSPETKKNDMPVLNQVGIGKIQITEQIGGATSSHRHDFIVTQMPDEENSLIGFFLVGSKVNSIRVDLWEKGKPFIYFDSYNNEIIKGHSE